MNRTLAGKTIFISGGSRGIGLAIALRAARDGANVAIAAKTRNRIRHCPGRSTPQRDRSRKPADDALPLVCDIRDEEQVEAAVAATVARFGGIDICLNNASAVRLTENSRHAHEALRSDQWRQHPRHLPGDAEMPAASLDRREPAYSYDFATAPHGGALVRAARCLFDCEIRHESRDARRRR